MSNAFDKASLVMLPHAYEDGKLYSLKPTDRSGDFTFSRGTDTATRVGEDGYIKKETQNLILNSQNFGDSQYVPDTNMSKTTGQTDPNGGDTAVLVSNPSQSNGYLYSSVSLQANTINTFSIYIKGESAGSVSIRIDDSTTGTQHNVNYTTEWTRVSCYELVNQTDCRVVIGGFNTWTAGQNIYFAFAQVEQGLVAQDYLETTTAPVYGGLTDDMPRLDYSGGATCPSLLLEPERQNLWYHSEYYDSLSGANGAVFNYNDGISPEGVQNAVRVSASSAGARIQPNLSVNGNKLVWSLYVKHEGDDYSMRLNNYLGGTATYGATVTVTSTAVTFDGYASGYDDADYEVIGDGWFRFWIVITPEAGGQLFQFRVLEGNSVATSYLAYGMQVEYGSYPTSYIPTYGSAQTRASDNPAQLDVTNLTSTYNTLYTEFEVSNITNQGKIALSDNSQDNRMTIYQNGDDLMLLLNAGGSSQTSIISSNILSVGTNYKVVVKNQNGSHALFINGTKIREENSTAPTGLSKLRFGNEADSIQTQKFLGDIKQTLLFPEALSDDECIALTTL